MCFATGAFQALELFERDPQLASLMAFERTAQALLEQFTQCAAGCAVELLGFSFPKHRSLLRYGMLRTQVWLDHLPETRVGLLEPRVILKPVRTAHPTRVFLFKYILALDVHPKIDDLSFNLEILRATFRNHSFVATFEIPGQFRQHQLRRQPFEIGDAFQKPFGLVSRNGFDGSTVMLEQHRSIFQGAIRKRCALEFAVLVNLGFINLGTVTGHE